MEIGKQSIRLEKPAYVESWAWGVGKKEGEGPLAPFFDEIETDDQLGQDNWEEAESMLQQKAARLAIKKAGCCPEDIRIIFAGDLLAQSIASSFGIGELERPMYGVFGACSTMGEALSLGAITVSAGHGERVLAVTSSHFATAEKEFRFPLGYGNQRPLSASWTVTGSGACVLNRKKGRVKITGLTIGKVVDYGLKDQIITGDLGYIGQQILLDLLEKEGYQAGKNHKDCGILMYDQKTQDTHAGGSGCGCSASVLAGYILPKIACGDWKRVLFVPTGALMSKVSFSEGNSVPGIAQGVVLEWEEGEVEQTC